MATYGFSEGDAKRIGQAVRRVERGPEQVRLGGPRDDGAAPGVRVMIGQMSSNAWSKQTSQTIEIYTGDHGSAEYAHVAVSAFNYFADIATSESTSRWVAVSNNGWGWVLIAAECD